MHLAILTQVTVCNISFHSSSAPCHSYTSYSLQHLIPLLQCTLPFLHKLQSATSHSTPPVRLAILTQVTVCNISFHSSSAPCHSYTSYSLQHLIPLLQCTLPFLHKLQSATSHSTPPVHLAILTQVTVCNISFHSSSAPCHSYTNYSLQHLIPLLQCTLPFLHKLQSATSHSTPPVRLAILTQVTVCNISFHSSSAPCHSYTSYSQQRSQDRLRTYSSSEHLLCLSSC